MDVMVIGHLHMRAGVGSQSCSALNIPVVRPQTAFLAQNGFVGKIFPAAEQGMAQLDNLFFLDFHEKSLPFKMNDKSAAYSIYGFMTDFYRHFNLI